MTDYLPPDFTRITRTVTEVTDNLKRTRRPGGLWRSFDGGQIIQRGDDYMDGARTLFLHCRPLMEKREKVAVRSTYQAARKAREKLDASDVSSFWNAREYKGLSKEAFKTAKRASNRTLDNRFVDPLDGIDSDPPGSQGGGAPLATSDELDGTNPSARAPPATQEGPRGTDLLGRTGFYISTHGTVQAGGLPPATPEELDGAHPPAGAPPPVTPEEPDRPPPHDPGTESHATLPPRAAGSGGPTNEVRDTYSFIYDQDFASSEASIASYKTERTVNSRKSRYNTLSRRKHTDSGHLGVTEGIASLNVDDASVQGVEVPTAGLPPGPSWMTDREQEVDNLSYNLSDGLCSVSEILLGADDYLDD